MTQRTGDITLELETLRLVISPSVGASIVSLEIRDNQGRWAHVLRCMPPESRDPSDAASFVMLPWTNRVKDASFAFGGASHALTPNHSDGTAIHGVGRDLPWEIADRSPITARLTLDSRNRDEVACPFDFGAVQRFEIGPRSVEIDLSVTNLGQTPMPAGCGHHPYFHRHLFSDADELRVRMNLAGRYPANACIPTGAPVDDEVCASLREGKALGNPGLDDVFAGFGGEAVLDWPQSNVRLRMACDEPLGHMVIYTPRRADGQADEFVCVEPVTMVNDGFNLLSRDETGTGVVVLKPGQTLRTRMSLKFSAAE